jgi:hypothetical protein
METVAVAALKSLDSDAFTRASPDHVLPGTIKLTEETLSRLAHLLKSGCSIQLACDEVIFFYSVASGHSSGSFYFAPHYRPVSDRRFSNVLLPLG